MLLKYKTYLAAVVLISAVILVPMARADEITAKTQERDQLQAQLDQIEEQIAIYEKELAQTTTQKNTLANKIKKLKSQQAALKLQIQETTLKLAELEKNLTITNQSISAKAAKLESLKIEIAGLLRQLHSDNQNVLTMIMTARSLGDAYVQVKNYFMLTQALSQLMGQTKDVKAQLETQRTQYEEQQTDNEKLLSIKSIQQNQLVTTLQEQNSLLQETKGQESSYQAILADQKKQAAAIRNRIYELFSMTTQITFGQALEIANWASGLTGVRPAFLLAILTQESNLGKNVGTCNRLGDPPEKSWKVVMKPERDQEPFKKITTELNLDIDSTPVSCPMHDAKGNQVGWGGGMGPAQFIPSTWMGYKDKVAAMTGKSPANPWDIRDAFIASAIKLKAAGADSKSGEWKAAMIYFSGGTNSRYSFYGDNVVATANKYQSDIDQLQ
ncbi:MAG: hypothetical protein WC526_03435 [Patescibacteria group bacterium]